MWLIENRKEEEKEIWRGNFVLAQMERVLHLRSLGSQCWGRGKENTKKRKEEGSGGGGGVEVGTTVTSQSCYEAAVSNLAEPHGVSNISEEMCISSLPFLMEFPQVKDATVIVT